MSEEKKKNCEVFFNPPAKILVVDDSQLNRSFVVNSFQLPNYAIISAVDAQDGISKAKSFLPELILLDVMMPVMNGHEACAKLKGNKDTADIPVILLTAVADRVTTSTYTHRDMLESEAEDYMPKPVEPKELLELIKNWLNK